MLKRHFGNEAYYSQLVDLFLETTFQVTSFSSTSASFHNILQLPVKAKLEIARFLDGMRTIARHTLLEFVHR